MSGKITWREFSSRLQDAGVDWGLFTVLEVDWDHSVVRRSYSSDEANYPSSGEKSLMASDWAMHVIFGQTPWFSSDSDSFRRAFSDAELLESLGLRYALNVPVLECARTVRTLNFLRGERVFDAEALKRINAALSDL